ncbi:MAG: CoA pyrophosphatase [Acidimicrobiia bacterium]
MDKWSSFRNLNAVVDPPGSEAAVLVALYADANDDIRIVLTKRPDDMPTHPGDVVFPGGHREGGEEPISTATREAWEEIGLPPENIIEVFGGLDPVTTRDRDKPIVPVVVRIERPTDFVVDPKEVDVVIEPTIAELLDEDSWTIRPWFGYPLWFYEFDEGILWGATAFMVRNLLEVVRSNGEG